MFGIPRSHCLSRHGFASRNLRVLAALTLAALAGGCGGDGVQPPAGGGTGNGPPGPSTSRLSWSQAASSLASVQSYRFALFVDGTRSSLENVTCAGGSSPYGCSTPLPSLSSGRHVLELVSIDQATGLESPRSEPLVVGAASVTAPAGAASERPGGVSNPSVTCAAGDASLCFTATLVADDLDAVHRLQALPDGRILVLHESGDVTFLPARISERPEFRQEPGDTTTVADVAVDPDFSTNRFLYFATVATEATRDRRVSIVRVRELADRLGEAATIVADLPAAPVGSPALSVGPDRRLYLAMPAAPGAAPGQRPYDAQVLRFTRDGGAAGDARSGSPVLARGTARPASLLWDSGSRLLITSDDTQQPMLGVVALGDAPTTTLALVGGDPPALYIARLAAGRNADLTSLQPIPLGALVPAAVAVVNTGDLVVAVRVGEASRARLLRLRPSEAR